MQSRESQTLLCDVAVEEPSVMLSVVPVMHGDKDVWMDDGVHRDGGGCYNSMVWMVAVTVVVLDATTKLL